MIQKKAHNYEKNEDEEDYYETIPQNRNGQDHAPVTGGAALAKQ